MNEPTLRQQCLAVAHRFSAYLPEPLEPNDCDELMHYIEDLVQQQLAAMTAERDALANDLPMHSVAYQQRIAALEQQLVAMTQERNEAETRNENYRLKLNARDQQIAEAQARAQTLAAAALQVLTVGPIIKRAQDFLSKEEQP